MGSGAQSYNTTRGTKRFSDIIVGSLGLGCFSRNPIEAESIASDVWATFRYFKEELQKAGFYTLQSTTLGALQLVEQQGYDKLFMTPVSIMCQLQDQWRLEPEVDIKLRKLIIDVFATSPEPVITQGIELKEGG